MSFKICSGLLLQNESVAFNDWVTVIMKLPVCRFGSLCLPSIICFVCFVVFIKRCVSEKCAIRRFYSLVRFNHFVANNEEITTY